MLIEINEDYIQWVKSISVKSNTSVDCEELITEYINEVLEKHKQSWEDWLSGRFAGSHLPLQPPGWEEPE